MELPKIREIREDKKYTQLYMAKKMGITQPRYNQLENEGHWSAEQLVTVSKILATPEEELLKGNRPCKGK